MTKHCAEKEQHLALLRGGWLPHGLCVLEEGLCNSCPDKDLAQAICRR